MIENLKDLQALLKLCRKQGVTEIKVGNVELKLGEAAHEPYRQVPEEEVEAEDKWADFPDGTLTTEELTWFANGGLPEDNPYRQQHEN